ncbi:hypothetical protein PUV47_01270 [Pseudovibrio exalbescens]|uniref:hypothetical protein n=1 Tax=Pseudovibrio exalbescens TaxID=197461 RepID=UPI002365EC16|nr:hypothetical protein [Pseudovibrio exalbescens]MDD7908531.1 hypothetical protein [Pseudovibrio exalbescens]
MKISIKDPSYWPLLALTHALVDKGVITPNEISDMCETMKQFHRDLSAALNEPPHETALKTLSSYQNILQSLDAGPSAVHDFLRLRPEDLEPVPDDGEL